jgi:hypothetical protein
MGSVACLLGCSDPPGLAIQVTPGAAVTKVEFVVGGHWDGSVYQTMAAPQVAPRDTAVRPTVHETAWFAEVSGGTAGFALHADGTDNQSIEMLAVIGYDANQTPIEYAVLTGVEVPANEAVLWQVPLKPIAPLGTAPEGFAAWHASNQSAPSCVMLERDHESSAIVPQNDPDCDAVAKECAPTVPNAMNVPPSFSSANCALVSNTGCVMGGTSCTDGIGPTSGCAPLEEAHCLPALICTCAPMDRACMENKILDGVSGDALPKVECTFPIDINTGNPCPLATAKLDASIVIKDPLLKCKAIHVLKGFSGLPKLVDQIGFLTGLASLSNFRDPCAIDVTWSGHLDGTGYAVEMADIELSNGRHVTMPFELTVTRGCTTEPPVCKVSLATSSTGETIFTCASQ